MITTEFAYYRPDSVVEATALFQELLRTGQQPIYYSGGTEIITLGRLNRLAAKAVIDLKGIPECCALGWDDDRLVIGAANSITRVCESGHFPLFTETAGRIADHTSRGKITVGGNICGGFMYREAVLAFLVTDSEVVLAGPNGVRTVPLTEVFASRLQLDQGEFLVQLRTPKMGLRLPHRGVKKTKDSRINYPLVSVAMLKQDGHLRLAISGLCPFPFRSQQMEEELSDTDHVEQERVTRALTHLPAPAVDDLEASADYRQYLLSSILHSALAVF